MMLSLRILACALAAIACVTLQTTLAAAEPPPQQVQLAPAPAPPPQPSAAVPLAPASSPPPVQPPVALDTPPPTAAPSEPPAWRGWQTLMVDLAGLAIGVGVASAHSDLNGPGIVAATWYGVGVLGAPAVHYAHNQWPVGLSDVAMRAFAPPLLGLGGLVASCLAHEEFKRSCSQSGLSGGMLFGLAGIAVLDALALSNATPRKEERPQSWYGVQTLAIDAVAYGIGGFYASKKPAAGKDRVHPAVALWVMDYLIGSIGSPIVHFIHGNVGRGFASLGSRLLVGPMFTLVGLIGGCAGTAGKRGCESEGAEYGLLGGSIAVALFDGLVLAREPKEPATASNVNVTVGAGSVGLTARW